MEKEKYLSLKEAVEITGKSIATLRRRKNLLEELGAICSNKGWKVTIEQLEKAGLMKVSESKNSKKLENNSFEKELRKEKDLLIKIYETQINDLKSMLDKQINRAEKAEKRLEKMMDILEEKYVITRKQKQGLGQVFKR